MGDSSENKAFSEFEGRRPSLRNPFILKILWGPDTVFGTRLSGELDESVWPHQVYSLVEEADQRTSHFNTVGQITVMEVLEKVLKVHGRDP